MRHGGRGFFVDISSNAHLRKNEEIKQFINRINYDYIYESSDDMKQSYIIVDSEGNISTNNSHISNISIFTYELDEAIKLLNVDYKNYIKRYI